MTPATQPFVQQLEDHHSAESITALLQGHVQAFGDSWRMDRMMGLIKSIVCDVFILGGAIGLVRQALINVNWLLRISDTVVILIFQPLLPGKAILTGLVSLLTVCVLLLLPSRA